MNYKDLNCWKFAIELVNSVYELTNKFPDYEKYALRTQINRAVVSISSNIAEGSARKNNKEFIQFLYIALGSASELETQLIIAQNLKYISSDFDIYDKIVEVKKLILGLIKYLSNKG